MNFRTMTIRPGDVKLEQSGEHFKVTVADCWEDREKQPRVIIREISMCELECFAAQIARAMLKRQADLTHSCRNTREAFRIKGE